MMEGRRGGAVGHTGEEREVVKLMKLTEDECDQQVKSKGQDTTELVNYEPVSIKLHQMFVQTAETSKL